MAIPPKGHPDRPLRLAARSMMGLGVILLVLSTCAGIGLGIALARGPGGGGTPLLAAVGLFFYVAPGVALIVCSIYLKRYRMWAAIVGLVLAGMACLFSLVMLLGFVFATVSGGGESIGLLLTLIPLLFVAAFIQLIVHLARSFNAIRIHQVQGPQGHGFQPIYAAEPVDPLQIDPYQPPTT